MPIYEYEPEGRECMMCDGRVVAIQGIDEAPLAYCPDCGLEVRRVISSVSFKVSNAAVLGKSGDKGFTTWKKVEAGKWEKVSGPGVDIIVGDPKDVSAVQQESRAKKVIDLDSQ